MALLSPSSSSPAKKKTRMRGTKKKVIDGYIAEARVALAAAQDSEDGDDAAAAAALGLASAVLEIAPRLEAALEVQARALLALRRYRDVADLLREYIPSCSAAGNSKDVDSSSSCSSGSGTELLSPEREREVGAGWSCFDVLELKRRVFSWSCWKKSSDGQGQQWRYLVLGQACFHLGLMEDAVVLLQTGRRLATAAFRRESVCWSDDSFSSSPEQLDVGKSNNNNNGVVCCAQLLAHVKLLLRRRAAAAAALDAGLPNEAVRHFNKVLDARRGGVLPHPFATACLVGRAAAFRAAGRPADAIADCNRALALDPAFIPALRARADLLESVGAVPDCLRDLDHLKLLYDAALRDGKLPGPTWRPQGGIRFAEIAGAHRTLTARIQQLRARVVAGGGEGVAVDYYALLGVRRGCTRAELERAHLLLTLKLKPDRSTSFAERLQLVDEHRDLEAVRDQARMSALFLYRMLQKGYSFIMAAVLDQEAADRQRAKEDAAKAAAAMAAAAESLKQQEQQLAAMPAEKSVGNVVEVTKKVGNVVSVTNKTPIPPAPRAVVTMAATSSATPMSPPFQGVFCRDMAVVGNLLSRGGFDHPIAVKCEAMSC